MLDRQKYAQGVRWNLLLDTLLAVAVVVPVVTLVLLLI
jgi:hypothetical protein